MGATFLTTLEVLAAFLASAIFVVGTALSLRLLMAADGDRWKAWTTVGATIVAGMLALSFVITLGIRAGTFNADEPWHCARGTVYRSVGVGNGHTWWCEPK